MTSLDGEILEPQQSSREQARAADETSIRDGFWRTFAKAAGQIPFAEDLVAAYYCALDPQTPRKAKAVLFGALAYFIMPIDAIPDILALVGFSDDVAVLTLAFAAIRSHLTDAHRAAARKALSDFAAGKKAT